MAAKCVIPHHFARTSLLEPFRRTLVCLELRHKNSLDLFEQERPDKYSTTLSGTLCCGGCGWVRDLKVEGLPKLQQTAATPSVLLRKSHHCEGSAQRTLRFPKTQRVESP